LTALAEVANTEDHRDEENVESDDGCEKESDFHDTCLG